VDVATDGEIGLDLATTWEYELILLDLLIPKVDGISLCRQLRAKGFQKPILLLTVKDARADVVKGLDAGADDYVTKPYDLSELLARIRALLRRGETNLSPNLLTWGRLAVNPVSAEVRYGEKTLSLSPKEYGLLGLFLRNPQRVFSRSDIIDRLWSIDASPSEGAVTNLIKDLRQKLKAAGMTADLLETVYGLGYRLKAAPSGEPDATSTGGHTWDELEKRQSTGQLKKTTTGKKDKNFASINKVLERYRNTFAARLVVLEQVGEALQMDKLTEELQQAASHEAHKLAGTLGSFGYETGSRLAQTIEQLLTREAPLGKTALPQLQTLIANLKHELTKPAKPLTAQPLEPIKIPRILVIDQDEAFTQQLKSDAFAWGLQVETAASLRDAVQRIQQITPGAVLLSLQAANKDEIAMLLDFKQQFPDLAILVISEEDSLTDRVTVSRLGVRRFLYKPITSAQVFESIAQVLPKPPAADAKVMILDDDPIVLDALSLLLQPWGLQVKILQDPRQFWNVLTATTPDLLVMDLEMPTFNGIDLCRVVRQDPKWGNLPILVVTAHTDMESIQQVFAAGADDFISKPVVGPELVTRVISRIDRSRLQQELETMKRRIGA
ncbi:multi-component transcriptional regulator, partial [filamentous cyanobacterium CCP1]